MHTLQRHKNVFIMTGIIGVLLVAIGGFYLGFYSEREKYMTYLSSFQNIRENSDKYSFVNPLIGGVSAPATDVGMYSDLKDDIMSYLTLEKRKGNLYDYSFYFRDQNTGFWFGGNESNGFFPASLFKLPIAIAVYQEGEDNPSFLTKQLVYTENLSNINNATEANAESGLTVGQTYSVPDLVNKMLTLSDNGAKNLLLSVLDKKYLDDLFARLSLVDPNSTKIYEVSSLKYAYFLRVLYNASYLNEDHSELILGMLAKSAFKNGLVAGVPSNVQVAHKFGVYNFTEKKSGQDVNTVQLHDCGVIYDETKPYILCIMTKGKDDKSLFDIISHVSKMIYDYQEANN
jgi:beta-lactamase class A